MEAHRPTSSSDSIKCHIFFATPRLAIPIIITMSFFCSLHSSSKSEDWIMSCSAFSKVNLHLVLTFRNKYVSKENLYFSYNCWKWHIKVLNREWIKFLKHMKSHLGHKLLYYSKGSFYFLINDLQMYIIGKLYLTRYTYYLCVCALFFTFSDRFIYFPISFHPYSTKVHRIKSVIFGTANWQPHE